MSFHNQAMLDADDEVNTEALLYDSAKLLPRSKQKKLSMT
jgi:hypothetical protein